MGGGQRSHQDSLYREHDRLFRFLEFPAIRHGDSCAHGRSAQGRGGQGVIAIQTSERNGNAIGAVQVLDTSQIMLITNGGTLVRTPVADVSIVGRNTQGVTLIRLNDGEKLVQLAPILSENVETGLEDESEAAVE